MPTVASRMWHGPSSPDIRDLSGVTTDLSQSGTGRRRSWPLRNLFCFCCWSSLCAGFLSRFQGLPSPPWRGYAPVYAPGDVAYSPRGVRRASPCSPPGVVGKADDASEPAIILIQHLHGCRCTSPSHRPLLGAAKRTVATTNPATKTWRTHRRSPPDVAAVGGGS